MAGSSIIQNAFEKTFTESTAKGADNIDFDSYKAKIVVIGCGGGGTNTINTLTNMGISGASTIAINTDAKHLAAVNAHKKILIGKELTKGLGAGGYPKIGEQAAVESKSDIKAALEGADLVFVTAGMGGGTGTGAASVVARIAKEMGAMVIGTVTMPFKIEGARIGKAEDGLYQLRQACDTVIVIENDKLLRYAGNLPLKQAFMVADELIASMIKGISECISEPSLVNLDFADVRSIMSQGGVAMIGVGESNSSDKGADAVQKALNNPLLEVDYSGGAGALIHITCGEDVTLDEINKAGEIVSKHLDSSAPCIWGARIEPGFQNKIRVITIITGVKSPYVLGKLDEAHAKQPQTLDKQLGISIVKSKW
jgi:cell division protein FtsZ